MSVAEETTFRSKLESLGTVESILNLADAGFAPTERPRVNAHVHLPPNFTAFETTEQAIDLAQAQGVGVLGASNYYDYEVYVEFAAEAGRRGIFPLFGLEIISLIDDLVKAGVRINDPGNPGKMYICGKGITRFSPLSAHADALLGVIRGNDSQRMAEVTDRLAALFAEAGVETELDAEKIKKRVADRHRCEIGRVYLQERHLALAFQERLFEIVGLSAEREGILTTLFGVASKNAGDTVGVQNEIRSHLMKAGKPGFVADTFVDFDHAYQLILALGGIPCYPTLADGVSPLTQYEFSAVELVADLKARGIPSAEFIPNRNTPEVLSRYVHTMRDAGLIVTAGTEHNTLELLPISPVCLKEQPIPDDIQDIFWEGACVVAAHQYLTSLGKPGYVSENGALSTEFTSAEERIESFRRIGATVIAKYQEASARA